VARIEVNTQNTRREIERLWREVERLRSTPAGPTGRLEVSCTGDGLPEARPVEADRHGDHAAPPPGVGPLF
jgi:hypothetical protein